MAEIMKFHRVPQHRRDLRLEQLERRVTARRAAGAWILAALVLWGLIWLAGRPLLGLFGA